MASDDIVLDPAFLGRILTTPSTEKQRERFKKYNIFGIEQESAVAALAIVN